MLALVFGGCDREAPPAAPAALVEIPRPHLESLEPHVRHQIETMQIRLDDALAADPYDPAELSRLFGEQGKLYFAYRFEQAAQACFVNALRLAPREAAWAYFLGHLFRQAGHADESRAHFEQALERDPDYLPIYLALAELHVETNQLDEATRLLSEVLKKDPNNASALVGLGRLSAMRDDPDQAVTYLEAARRLAPDATEIHYPLGLAYRAQGALDKARYFLERRGTGRVPQHDSLMDAVKVLASGRRAYEFFGNEAYMQGNYQEAIAAFQKALEIDPESAEVRLNLGATFSQVNNLEAAQQQFREVLRLEPGNARAHFSLGTLLARQNRDEPAVSHYQQALASDPAYKDAHFNLANALFRLRRFEEAQAHFLRVVEADHRNGAARYGRAVALIHQKRWQGASGWLEESYALLPEHTGIVNILARMLAACPQAALRDGARALAMARGLVQVERSLFNVEVLAMALAEVGRFEEAVNLQEQALAAARQAGRADLETPLVANLARYRAGRPAREPLGD